jgi:hypothetical protein
MMPPKEETKEETKGWSDGKRYEPPKKKARHQLVFVGENSVWKIVMKKLYCKTDPQLDQHFNKMNKRVQNPSSWYCWWSIHRWGFPQGGGRW